MSAILWACVFSWTELDADIDQVCASNPDVAGNCLSDAVRVCVRGWTMV
ncbi:hypothetical protein PITCH_A220021 [uncultured Desulfobacterium sp.]|uniref:Uncharacterized protein n=1 Tax=uncultured Desulfobacterium sp. TaxID=201089 RepID=A0A445MXJ4_9BACT|nr:hypothetical protein PITCH_A220021 [uncultured Desulfobacterium sp.]